MKKVSRHQKHNLPFNCRLVLSRDGRKGGRKEGMKTKHISLCLFIRGLGKDHVAMLLRLTFFF